MNKVQVLNISIIINLLFLFLFSGSVMFYNDGYSSYFKIGWSDNFVFASIIINDQIKYIFLCLFITVLNISEIFLNDIATPLINFTTYNPYKIIIHDFSRCELECYSNIIFFIQTTKRFIQIYVTFSQIDIAFISLLSSQGAVAIAIRYLLDKKTFVLPSVRETIQQNYQSIDQEISPIITRVSIQTNSEHPQTQSNI